MEREQMAELFSTDLNIDRIIMGIELYAGRKIDSDKALLIFDEVQELPRALSSLKYFSEDAPQYHIVCAGSLLGIALHEGTSFSVGKVVFAMDIGEQIVPVEVKAEVNLKAKSLKTYSDRFNPKISVRTSMADYQKEDWLINLPLYAVEEIRAILE